LKSDDLANIKAWMSDYKSSMSNYVDGWHPWSETSHTNANGQVKNGNVKTSGTAGCPYHRGGVVQHLFRQKPLQPAVLILKVLQPPDIRNLKAAIPGFPFTKGGVRHTALAA